eukprot:6985087-Alexandrium_andersonii.AAC.1
MPSLLLPCRLKRFALSCAIVGRHSPPYRSCGPTERACISTGMTPVSSLLSFAREAGAPCAEAHPVLGDAPRAFRSYPA